MIKLLFLGDIVGKSGRQALETHLPALRKTLNLDCVIANAENAAHGFGITKKISEELFSLGVDVLTTGNHVWDKTEVISYISQEPRLIRPANYPSAHPGKGAVVFETLKGAKILVVNVMGRLFMEHVDNPFEALDREIQHYKLGKNIQAIFVDFHAEASSEKMAAARYLDGRISAFVGTHTHVPTADNIILPNGTGYQTDVGMCGCYDSVIGMRPDASIARFMRTLGSYTKMEPMEGPATLCGVYFEIDPKTGKCHRIAPVRLGGLLEETADL